MDTMKHAEPRLDEISPLDRWIVRYDRTTDTVIMHRDEPRSALSVELDDQVWARIQPESLSGGSSGPGWIDAFLGFVRDAYSPAPTAQRPEGGLRARAYGVPVAEPVRHHVPIRTIKMAR